MPPVPNHIRRLREAHGISASAFAEELGIERSTLSRWEIRDREVGDEMKMRIAEYFNLPVQAIFDLGYDPLRDALLRTMDALAALQGRLEKVEKAS